MHMMRVRARSDARSVRRCCRCCLQQLLQTQPSCCSAPRPAASSSSMRTAVRRLLAPALAVVVVLLLPTSHPRSPFDAVHMTQPVPGAVRGVSPDAWREGK
eukprot:COSAG06_NODE_25023_length_647_cov_1.125912_1_plen_100_part_01